MSWKISKKKHVQTAWAVWLDDQLQKKKNLSFSTTLGVGRSNLLVGFVVYHLKFMSPITITTGFDWKSWSRCRKLPNKINLANYPVGPYPKSQAHGPWWYVMIREKGTHISVGIKEHHISSFQLPEFNTPKNPKQHCWFTSCNRRILVNKIHYV